VFSCGRWRSWLCCRDSFGCFIGPQERTQPRRSFVGHRQVGIGGSGGRVEGLPRRICIGEWTVCYRRLVGMGVPVSSVVVGRSTPLFFA
jgi:hypothetical protein